MNELVKGAIKDEIEAIETYHKILSECKEPEHIKIFERILADEERHLLELKDMQEGKVGNKEYSR